MQSDHPWIAARLSMNGAGPTEAPTATTPTAVPTTTGGTSDCALGATVTVGTCADPTIDPATDPYGLGPVQPQLARLVSVLAPLFAIQTVGGYRDSARDPDGHPAGLAADFMVPLTVAGARQGTALADYARSHAAELRVDYIIWDQRIWSAGRADEGWRPMRDRGSPTENHRDHVHINALPTSSAIGPSTPATLSPARPGSALRSSTRSRSSTSTPTNTTGTPPGRPGPPGTPEPTSPCPAVLPCTQPMLAPSRSTPCSHGPART